MKRALSFVLLMALLVPMVATETFAIGPSTAPNNASMTIAEFTNAYVGDTAAPASTSSTNENDSNSGDAPDIAYSGISYNTSTRVISFDAEITANGEVTAMSAEGTLYNSYKKDHGINSIVGDLQDTTGQYEILRFEIYNDNDLSKLYAVNTPETATTPVLLLYLLADNELYLFETAIPSEMSAITLPNTPDCKTNEGAIDGFWFENIVAPVVGEESIPPFMTLDDTDTIVKPAISASWTISGVVYRYYAKPYIYYRFANVDDATTTWQATFGIDDAYSYVDGVKSTLTGLRITNIDLSFVTGKHTLALRGYSEFDLHDSFGTIAPSSISGYIGIAAGATGSIGAEVASAILTDLLEAGYSSKKITSGEWKLLATGNANTQGRDFRYFVPDRYFMQHTDNFLTYQLDVAASNFGLSSATSGNREGELEISFDYYTGDGTTKYSKTYSVTGSYYCTVTRP